MQTIDHAVFADTLDLLELSSNFLNNIKRTHLFSAQQKALKSQSTTPDFLELSIDNGCGLSLNYEILPARSPSHIVSSPYIHSYPNSRDHHILALLFKAALIYNFGQLKHEITYETTLRDLKRLYAIENSEILSDIVFTQSISTLNKTNLTICNPNDGSEYLSRVITTFISCRQKEDTEVAIKIDTFMALQYL